MYQALYVQAAGGLRHELTVDYALSIRSHRTTTPLEATDSRTRGETMGSWRDNTPPAHHTLLTGQCQDIGKVTSCEALRVESTRSSP